jgi:hypothetical protein
MKLISGVLLMFFLFACGGEGGVSSNHQQGEQREEDDSLPDFSTRLTNNLLISGEQCSGNESTDSEGQTFNCEATEWLITVDNINTCNPDGCTEVEVIPIIGILVPVSSQGDTSFFDIEASIPVNDSITNILDTVTVRFRPNDSPLVLFK